MEAIKLIGNSHEGKLIISVPEEFNEKELEVMIISSKDRKDGDKDKVDEDIRREKFMKIFGSAKHPDFPMTKYDTYDQ